MQFIKGVGGELMSMSGPQQESRNARVMLALMVPGVCIYPVCDLACEFCDLNSLVVRTISISLPISLVLDLACFVVMVVGGFGSFICLPWRAVPRLGRQLVCHTQIVC